MPKYKQGLRRLCPEAENVTGQNREALPGDKDVKKNHKGGCMININSSIASVLSNIYTANDTSLNDSLSKIASGKRVQSPSDDFAGYARASGLNQDISQYNQVKQNLQDAKSYTDYGTAVGNNVLSDLTQMKDLATSFANTTDATQQAALTTQFTSLQAGIADQIANSKYDGTQIYATTLAKTVNLDTNGTKMTITPTAVGDASALTIGGGAVAVQAEITNAQQYVSDMQSFGTQITRQSNLTDTIISSKQATVSAIMDVNEAEEESNVTNLQVRQQATVSMMSQANLAQSAIAKLFG